MAVNVKDCSCYDRLYYCKKELREILNMSTNSEGVATLFQGVRDSRDSCPTIHARALQEILEQVYEIIVILHSFCT